MAIEPIGNVSLRPDVLAPRRQIATSLNAPTFRDSQARNAQLTQAMQMGRETSALLSTLPGPNMTFFRPPSPPSFAGPKAPGGAGVGGRLSAPLLETMQAGRETSTLLSSLMGPGPRAFPAPVPPQFAQPGLTAGPTPAARAGLTAGAGQAVGAGQTPLAGGALPRTAAPLLETELQGRTTSTLLSGLMGPQQAGLQGSPFARPTPMSVPGGAMATMRTAQEVLQAVSTATPSVDNTRIANEAYQMETRAQTDWANQRAVGGPWTREWFR